MKNTDNTFWQQNVTTRYLIDLADHVILAYFEK
jgi:hypothetical protein